MVASFKSVLTVYFVSFVVLLFVLSMLFSGWFQLIEQLFSTCWFKGSDESQARKIRGSNYFLTPNGRPKGYCLITTWAMTHVVLYGVLGYLFPERFWETFIIGALFEGVEWVTFDCHDMLDLIWNSIGFFIGVYMRYV